MIKKTNTSISAYKIIKYQWKDEHDGMVCAELRGKIINDYTGWDFRI